MAGHIVLATCKPEQTRDIGQVFSLSFSWISPESKRWKEGSSRRQPANHHRKVLCSEEQWQLTTFRAIHSDEEETLLQRKRFTSAQKRFLETDAFSTSKNLIFCSYSKQKFAFQVEFRRFLLQSRGSMEKCMWEKVVLSSGSCGWAWASCSTCFLWTSAFSSLTLGF